ncbi:hypothetical protein [Haliscomenobacter sp.]|uniref:hypothetical protein n=1 Tax=Haliscomenobacter sp. TaxID=2717303 RepID=UPI003364DEDD
MYNNLTVHVKNHKEIIDVLNAVSSCGQYKNADEIAYQLGLLSAWIVRLSKQHYDVELELKQRLATFQEKR